jgi:hypothetical protein
MAVNLMLVIHGSEAYPTLKLTILLKVTLIHTNNQLYLQSLAPTNAHWARVVGYGPFSLWVIHKEGLCFSSGDIN